uniref:SCP domain-containing protein n=1 Tax=Strongyloides venezuelensis TaxID=75913 RepID=A0A0K0EZW2_STRVS
MNYYNNTLLVISIVLSIFSIGCQTYESKEASDKNSLLNLKLNDQSFSLKDIGKDSSKLNLVYGYVKNNDQRKRKVVINHIKIGPRRLSTTTRTTTKKVTTTKPRNPATKYIKMKYLLYRDINELRGKYNFPKLKVNLTLSIELQKYVVRFIKGDKTLKPRPPAPEDLYYFCKPGEKYDPIKFWSKDKAFLTREYIEMGTLDLFYSKLIWKSSKYIGCGVHGDVNGIATFCKITPRGNIKGQYYENVFNRG